MRATSARSLSDSPLAQPWAAPGPALTRLGERFGQRCPPPETRAAPRPGLTLWAALLSGGRELWTHKLRSLLTLTGVICGVVSLVTTLAIARGNERAMLEALRAIGGVQKVDVYETDVPSYQSHLAQQAVGLTIRDVEALERSAPLLESVAAELRLPDIVVSRQTQHFIPWSFLGTTPNALALNNHQLAHGRMFNELDDETARSVCVIGTAVRDALFGAPQEVGADLVPLGQIILVNQQPFTVIGMFAHYESERDRRRRELAGQRGDLGEAGPTRRRGSGRNERHIFDNKNATIYVPLRTAWMKLRPVYDPTHCRPLQPTSISLRVRDLAHFDQGLQQAKNVLMQTHRGIEDFYFFTEENWQARVAEATQNARLTGGVLAAISLIIGAIVIANIMLASLNERIREIGLRQALGASRTDIFRQILVEGTALALAGGLPPLLAAVAVIHAFTLLDPTSIPPLLTQEAVALALAASGAVGILASLYPALKAARLSPVRALRAAS